MFRIRIQTSKSSLLQYASNTINSSYAMIAQRPKTNKIDMIHWQSTKQNLKKMKHKRSSMISRTRQSKLKSYTNHNEKKHSQIACNKSKINNESMIYSILEKISKQTNIHDIPGKGKAIMKRFIFFLMGCMIFPIYFVSPTGPSMLPTLAPRDEILVIDRYFYLIWDLLYSIIDDTKIHSFNVGDIVLVCKPNDKQSNEIDKKSQIFLDYRERVIKRVISIGNSLEDETNDRLIQNQTNNIPLLSPGSIWVEGDNLKLSSDSRDYGPVKMEDIRGKIVMRLWPLSKFGPLSKERPHEPTQ